MIKISMPAHRQGDPAKREADFFLQALQVSAHRQGDPAKREADFFLASSTSFSAIYVYVM
jgi:hypothetical protein